MTTPSQERRRLQALERFQILDTPAEAPFDRLTALAAKLFDVPIAQISLIDAERQWIKSSYGTDPALREVPHAVSFCVHTIRQDSVMVVSDATQDARFADNPFVDDKTGIRFYAGATLRTDDGYNIGSLCVIDTEPRTFTDEQQALLSDLAATVVDMIEQHRVKQEGLQASDEQQQTAAELRLLASAVEATNDSILITDAGLDRPGPRIRYVNAAFTQMTGYRADEVIGKTPRILQGPGTDRAVMRQLRERLSAGQSFFGQAVNYRKDGYPFIIEWQVTPVKDDLGNIVNWVAVQRDITERVKNEDALRESEERFRQISDVTSDYVYAFKVGAEQRVVSRWVSSTFARLTGYTARELEAKGGWKTLIHLDDRPIAEARAKRLFAGHTDVSEYRIITKDGSVRWIRDYGKPTWSARLGRVVEIVGAGQDVTERKEHELRLRESEAHNRALLDAIPDAIVHHDREGRYLDVIAPRDFKPIRAVEALRGKTVDDIFDKPTADALHATFERAFQSGEVQFYEHTVVVDGEARDREIRVARIDDQECLMIVRDVTKQKRAARALQESEDRYRSVVSALTEGIVVHQADGQIVAANKSAETVLGLSYAQLIGRDSLDPRWRTVRESGRPFPGDQHPAMVTLRTGQPQTGVIMGVHKPDGSLSWLSVNSQPLCRAGEADPYGVVASFSDMTEQLRNHEELRQRAQQQEAIAALGQYALTHRDPHDVMDRATALLAEVLGVEYTKVLELSPDRTTLRLQSGVGWRDGLVGTTQIGIDPGSQATYTLHSNAPVVVDNLATETRFSGPSFLTEHGVHSGASVTIAAGGQQYGVLGVHTWTRRHFSHDDVTFLQSVAHIIAVALEHRADAAQILGLNTQLQQRLEQSTALYQISTAITQSASVSDTLDVFLEQVHDQLGADAADVLLFDEASQQLRYGASRGFRRSERIRQVQLELGAGWAGKAALSRRPYVVNDLATNEAPSPFSDEDLIADEGFTSYYALPLVAKGRLQGVLEVFRREGLEPTQSWHTFAQTLAAQAAIAIDHARLVKDLQVSNHNLTLAYDATIEGWAKALDLRDKETEGHSRRVTTLSVAIAREMGFSEEDLLQIRRGALLHDVGKLGVPDHILLKPGKLSDDEWDTMRKHPTYAYEMLEPIHFLRPALDIPYAHHERYDGSGYPRGLAGDQIPLAARIFAVVDVYDALRSDRPYRDGWPKDKVLAHIREQVGSHFDPAVIDVFLGLDDNLLY